MTTFSQRRKHIGRRPTAALAVGLLVVLGILTLPAFASENTNTNLADSILEIVEDAAAEAEATSKEATSEPDEPTAEELAEAKFAALSDDELTAFSFFTMSNEEREQFLAYVAPPPPAPAVSSNSSGSAPAPAASGGGVWDSLAQCEAGGNWSTNTGNGFHGGLQFHPQTWSGFGGGEFASTADQASREGQIAVAERVLASQGWGAWPGCTAKLGIR